MKKNTTYPISIIPDGILEATEGTIPCDVHPMKPKKKTMEKCSYMGEISLAVVIGIIVTYKFTSLPSITWVTITISALILLGVGFAVYEIIQNSIKRSENDRKQESFEFQMQQYLNDVCKKDDIEAANANPEKLTEYRRKKVKELLRNAGNDLRPVSGMGPKYYDYIFKELTYTFHDKVLINCTLPCENTINKPEPNFIVAFSEYNLFIDIEVDSPYGLDYRNPKCFTDGAEYQMTPHDEFFNRQKWVIMHFAEEQIVKYPVQCCKEIAKIASKITCDESIMDRMSPVDDLRFINLWTREQCERLARENYREQYLPKKPRFKPEEEFLKERKVLRVSTNNEYQHQAIPQSPVQIHSAPAPERKTIQIKQEPIIERIEHIIETVEPIEETPMESQQAMEQPRKEDTKAISNTESSTKQENTNNTDKNTDMENYYTNTPEQESTTSKETAPVQERPSSVNFGKQSETKVLPLYMKIADTEEDSITVKTFETSESTQEIEVNEVIAEEEENNVEETTTEVIEEVIEEPEAAEEVISIETPEVININRPTVVPQENFESPEAQERKIILDLVARMNEYHKTENWQYLLETCNRILAIDPKFQLAYMRRSSAYGNLGKLEESLADSKMVQELNPENPDSYYNAGIANLMLKRYRNAIEDFKNAVDHGISNPGEVLLTIANIYNKLSDEENYKDYLQKAAHTNNSAQSIMNKLKQQQESNGGARQEFSGINTKHLEIAHEGVSDMAFSVNDEFLAVADMSRKLRVFKTSDWQPIFKEDAELNAMAFSRNNRLMAIGGHSFLRVLNIADGSFQLYSDVVNYTGGVKKIFFHPFNNDTIFVSDNFSVYKVDIKTKVINKAISDFQLMAVSKDMQYIAGRDYFNNVKVYRINVLAEIFKLKIDPSIQINAMAINADCSRLIFGDSDGKVHVYNPQLPAAISVAEFNKEIVDIKISNGSYFSVLTGDRKISFFNVSTAQKGRELQLRFLPKMIQMANVNNIMAIGNFNQDVEVLYMNDSITETAPEAAITA